MCIFLPFHITEHKTHAPARWDRSVGTASPFGMGGRIADDVDQEDRNDAAIPASPRSTAAELPLARSCRSSKTSRGGSGVADVDPFGPSPPPAAAVTALLLLAANVGWLCRRSWSLSSPEEEHSLLVLLLLLRLRSSPRRVRPSLLLLLLRRRLGRAWLFFRVGLSPPALRTGSNGGGPGRDPGRSIIFSQKGFNATTHRPSSCGKAYATCDTAAAAGKV